MPRPQLLFKCPVILGIQIHKPHLRHLTLLYLSKVNISRCFLGILCIFMVNNAIISKSKSNNKKYTVILFNDKTKIKTLHFGSSGYDDYTTHKDETRKLKYISRHQAREDWNNPLTACFWSRWLLWNKKSLKSSIKDISTRFNIKIKVSI